ncbi:MAG: sigma-70 family RNA polymerase sigma factor [Kofleriaceae bacterium]
MTAKLADQLLKDAAWLRGLARTLAGNQDDADDLIQESWIAAWQRQPDTERPLRAWLTKVIRDVAGMKRRSTQRRALREARSDELPTSATPEELLHQMRLHRLLVDLVLELDEPYRSTIVAHFVEGRTLAEIARSSGIPAGTVRKRLWEALSRLRAALDARSGNRASWAPVLTFTNRGVQVAKSSKVGIVALTALLVAGTATVVHVRVGSRAAAPSNEQAPTVLASKPIAIDASSGAPSRSDARVVDRATMLAAIAKARSNGHSPPPATAEHSLPPQIDKPASTVLGIVDNTGDTSEWSKRALATINSLFGQCYDLARAEDPAFGGKLVANFKLVGEPGVGGLLEQAEILDEGTTITQSTFRDCITQQLYALELDPPPEGVTIERRIDLSF